MFPLNILDSVYQMANIYETVLACFLFDFFSNYTVNSVKRSEHCQNTAIHATKRNKNYQFYGRCIKQK